MENNNKESGFSYCYSAKEQAEIKKIREKYTAPTAAEDKMARLRRLDASVGGTAQAVALAVGMLGTLLLGFGMSIILSDLASALGLTGGTALWVGIPVGIAGGVLAALAYPVYGAILALMRKRYAPEILRLSDELMK